MTNNKACDQVLSLALAKSKIGVHAKCGRPLTEHYAMDAVGTLYAPIEVAKA